MSDDEKNKVVVWKKDIKVTAPPGPQWEAGTKVRSGKAKVDIDFVIDTTMSMNDKIAALLQTCQQFADESQQLNLDLSFTVVSFGDMSIQGSTDRIEVVISRNSDISKVKYALSHIPRNNGYANFGESSFEAIVKTMEQEHRTGAIKVMVLITDEPALNYQFNYRQIDRMLTDRQYIVFTVATLDQYYRLFANNHGGEWQLISANTKLDSLLAMFRRMISNITKVAHEVSTLTSGNVSEYLKLKSGK